ncbi:unnamed protein product [Soboliphyme baturini]|uniref:MFS domain-containing protein n=1 Tax=Soboliphyme baturini TaxID=241478 RepID=A0A183IF58_9BILA|nr:unnamed protein product [Soboliphyme baturini]
MISHNGKWMKPPVPWKAMAMSRVLWSNILAVLCHEAPMSAIMMFLPMYMRDVLHFCMKTNGMLSALPIACFLVFKILATHLNQMLQVVFQIDRTTLAKGFNFVACLGLGGFLLSVTNLDCQNRITAVILICLSIGFAGFHTPGCLSTLLSIAPTFSGTIASIAYFFASVSAMIIPLVVKSVVIYGTKAEWQLVLIATGCIALLPVVFFTLFGSAEEQPWAQPQQAKLSTVSVEKF